MKADRLILIATAMSALVACYASSDDDDINSDVTILDVSSDTTGADTDETDTNTSDTDAPDTDTPDTDTPDTDTPDTDTPDTDTPDTDTPDIGPVDIGQDADDETLCNDACSHFLDCTNTVCFEPILEFNACVDQCLPDPVEFQAELILSLSCDQLIEETCDPNSCECPTSTGGDCADGYNCLIDCEGDEACQQECFDTLSQDGQQTLNEMLTCFSDQCSGIPDEEFGACAESACGDEINTCFGDFGGNLFCLSECDTDMDCGVDEFCFALDQDLRGCVAGTPDEPGLPPDSPECNADQSCEPGQFCVQAGG